MSMQNLLFLVFVEKGGVENVELCKGTTSLHPCVRRGKQRLEEWGGQWRIHPIPLYETPCSRIIQYQK